MPSKQQALMSLVHEIRRSFQELGQYANALHSELGVNASMRAVLEFIHEHGAQTVPDIARAKSVTRQHIQTIVDQLLDRGLVEQRANPTHKRSYLIALTRDGRKVFAAIRRKEDSAFGKIAEALKGAGVNGADINNAAATMRALRSAINQQQQNGEDR